jgi:hypothetical protein
MPPPCSASGTGDHDHALSEESTRRRVPGVQIDDRRASRAEARALRYHRRCGSSAPACCHQPGVSCRGTLGSRPERRSPHATNRYRSIELGSCTPNRAEAWLGSWRGWVRVTAEAVPPVRQPVARSPPLRITGRAGRLPARTRSPAPSHARRNGHRIPSCTEVRLGPICVVDPDRGVDRAPAEAGAFCCIGASRRAHTGVCVRRVRPCRQRLSASR